MRASALVLAAVLLAPTLVAGAESAVVVKGPFVRVGEVAPRAPASARELELSHAPPPGGSRVFSRDEIVRVARASGFEIDARELPLAVRVVTASRTIREGELAALASEAIARALPEGVTLVRATPRQPATVAVDATVVGVEVPRAPRRQGAFVTTAMIELAAPGDAGVRVPVPVVLDVGPAAARAGVARGKRVQLVIETGAMRVATEGVALADADVGEVASFEVATTGRVVRAKVASSDEARVEAPR